MLERCAADADTVRMRISWKSRKVMATFLQIRQDDACLDLGYLQKELQETTCRYLAQLGLRQLGLPVPNRSIPPYIFLKVLLRVPFNSKDAKGGWKKEGGGKPRE